MDEETVVHPFNGILLGREKEQTPDTGDNRDDPQIHPGKVKRARLKAHTLSDSICTTFWKVQNDKDRNQILSVGWDLRGSTPQGQREEIFVAIKLSRVSIMAVIGSDYTTLCVKVHTTSLDCTAGKFHPHKNVLNG